MLCGGMGLSQDDDDNDEPARLTVYDGITEKSRQLYKLKYELQT